MFFFLNLVLWYRRTKMFISTISAYVVYHLQKNYPYLLIFAPIKDFLHVYNVEQPGQT